MAATAWAFYNKAKVKIGGGTIDLDTNIFRLQLHTSAASVNANNIAAISTAASIGNEVTNANGYATGGKSLTAVTWALSGANAKFDAADPLWTATGGNIANVKYGVIKNSVGQAMCYSKLSTAQFTIAIGNTLTVQMATTGIFVLS